ncbi:MAG: polysaccharide pyruvyl transferase family protein [Eubacterium sp.]|jgi:hypothetical protein|nr:polysaccharide pyruvyl transferase family protein [Eubacterium sp.]
MKYALIYYKNTYNIGDDILTYAEKRFLPRVDYRIDREEMDLFVPNEDEPTAAILNGWYLHHGYTFPPSPYILPFFIGAHFSRAQMRAGDYSFLDAAAGEYLKKYGPVGCRDDQTLKLLEEHGIPGYFSGCLTLTLPRFEHVPFTGEIVLTDVPKDVERYIKSRLSDQTIVCMTHTIASEEAGLCWEDRERRAERLLKVYQGAGLVVTTRLHCALPSIALGTPVILLGTYDEDYYARISDFTKLCPCFRAQEILEGKADALLLHPSPNDSGSLEIRNSLIRACETFIAEAPQRCKHMELPAKNVYREQYIERTVNMRRTIDALLNHCANLEEAQREGLEKLTRLASISQGLLRENERLQNLLAEQNQKQVDET